MRIHLRHGKDHLVVSVEREGEAYRVSVDSERALETRQVEVCCVDEDTLMLTIDGRRYQAVLLRRPREKWVAVGGEVYSFALEGGTPAAPSVATIASPDITAPMPGKVLQVLVRCGDRVEPGDGLVILEAMKMENRLTAEAAGSVTEVRVTAGEVVDGGQVLLVLTYEDAPPA